MSRMLFTVVALLAGPMAHTAAAQYRVMVPGTTPVITIPVYAGTTLEMTFSTNSFGLQGLTEIRSLNEDAVRVRRITPGPAGFVTGEFRVSHNARAGPVPLAMADASGRRHVARDLLAVVRPPPHVREGPEGEAHDTAETSPASADSGEVAPRAYSAWRIAVLTGSAGLVLGSLITLFGGRRLFS